MSVPRPLHEHVLSGAISSADAFLLSEWVRVAGGRSSTPATAAIELARFARVILDAAELLSSREGEWVRAMDQAGTIYGAARAVPNENAESLEVRMRRLAPKLRDLTLFFLRNAKLPSADSLTP